MTTPARPIFLSTDDIGDLTLGYLRVMAHGEERWPIGLISRSRPLPPETGMAQQVIQAGHPVLRLNDAQLLHLSSGQPVYDTDEGGQGYLIMRVGVEDCEPD